ncbi:MAG: hypothetical protein HZA77_02270 [Candidatus Schekmanbacteria bacterium]|nr:hypothetical protein [Candidatus Schekmanbacteria bacterium]
MIRAINVKDLSEEQINLVKEFVEFLKKKALTKESIEEGRAKKRIFELIEKNWRKNKDIPLKEIEAAVKEGVEAVRKKSGAKIYA